jgi:hypothetical protein
MENTTTTETKTDNAVTYGYRAEMSRTIIAQISDLDFWARARWGVKEMILLAGREDATVGVQFNCTKRIKIIVKLDADDTYSIEIGRLVGRFDYTKRAERDGVYAEQLVKVIDAEFSRAFGSL